MFVCTCIQERSGTRLTKLERSKTEFKVPPFAYSSTFAKSMSIQKDWKLGASFETEDGNLVGYSGKVVFFWRGAFSWSFDEGDSEMSDVNKINRNNLSYSLINQFQVVFIQARNNTKIQENYFVPAKIGPGLCSSYSAEIPKQIMYYWANIS